MRDAQPAALIAEILDLADRLRQHLDAPCVEHDVSASRFAVLEAVHQSSSAGIAQRELAGQLCLSESNVSVLVEALRKAGLLHRLRSKQDRRRSVLLLSEAGRELVELLNLARSRVVTSLLQGIPPQRISQLRNLLAELDHRLQSSESDASSLRRAS